MSIHIGIQLCKLESAASPSLPSAKVRHSHARWSDHDMEAISQRVQMGAKKPKTLTVER